MGLLEKAFRALNKMGIGGEIGTQGVKRIKIKIRGYANGTFQVKTSCTSLTDGKIM